MFCCAGLFFLLLVYYCTSLRNPGWLPVSHSIAELCDIHNRLAGSFFFFRGAGDRSRIARFIPTLAYQLSVFVPATKPFMQSVLQGDPLIIRQALSYQFMKLMVEPILSARNYNLAPANPMVVVIDGLDECDDKELMAQFIEIITNACQVDHQFPFRIFFTSRVEEHLRKKLEATAARSSIYPLVMQHYDASDDIRKFFQSRFSTIYEENCRLMQNVSLPWPSDWDLQTLVQKASGSFIFASTLINFVDDGSDLPHRKLPMALTVHAGLDPLYIQVLSAAPHSPHFERIIKTIILLKSPQSITFLGHLLQLETADVLQALLGIQSILMIPADNDHPIELFHTSLREFLTTESRSDAFFIGPAGHIDIMIDCLELMLIPPEDGVVFAGETQEYVSDNWCHHFDQALIEGGYNLIDSLAVCSLMTCLTDFFSHSSDMWINTLILKYPDAMVLNVMRSVLLKLKVSWMCVMLLISSNNSPSSNLQIVHNSCYKLWKILLAMQRYNLFINLQDCIDISIPVKCQSVSVQITVLFDINPDSAVPGLGCK
jgi:hypothetical protein